MQERACLKVVEHNGVTVVHLAEKRLLDATQIARIAQELNALVDSLPAPLVLLDFYNVDYFSSAALGMLVAINTRVRERGGQMRLANIMPQIMQVFTITKLDKVLRISSTRTGAMNVLSRIAQERKAGSP